MLAFQAGDPGSNPGPRIGKILDFNFDETENILFSVSEASPLEARHSKPLKTFIQYFLYEKLFK